jgi:hypothetical protein
MSQHSGAITRSGTTDYILLIHIILFSDFFIARRAGNAIG